MGLGKQAKVLSKHQQSAVLSFIKTTRQPLRNKVVFLLSVRAGLRAKEIASITWNMVCDAQGVIGNAIQLQNSASKGNSGGTVWLNSELKTALAEYKDSKGDRLSLNDCIVSTERNKATSPQIIVNMFADWYKKLGFVGASSHSGRRTFITTTAKKISTVGGSIRDVQMLARHKSLAMTQRYIEADVDAQKKVVELV